MDESLNHDSLKKRYRKSADHWRAPAALKGNLLMKTEFKHMQKNRIHAMVIKGAAAVMASLLACDGLVFAATGDSFIHQAVVKINGKEEPLEMQVRKNERGENEYYAHYKDENTGTEFEVISDDPEQLEQTEIIAEQDEIKAESDADESISTYTVTITSEADEELQP